MPAFTMTLKRVHDLEKGKIGLDDYPIFEEEHRKVLNQKIMDQYWNREICMETPSLWRFQMAKKMRLIMPKYNEHYKISAIAIDALSTADFKSVSDTDSTGNSESTGKNVSDAEAKSRAVSSDTPQTALQDNADYATAMQDNVSGSKAVSDTTNQDSTDQKAHAENRATGYQGHQPLLLLQARQTIINVDEMIIEELEELFMGIFSTGDSFTPPRGFNYGYYR